MGRRGRGTEPIYIISSDTKRGNIRQIICRFGQSKTICVLCIGQGKTPKKYEKRLQFGSQHFACCAIGQLGCPVGAVQRFFPHFFLAELGDI